MSYQSEYTGKEIDKLKNVGAIALTSEQATTLTLADTYYIIQGAFSDGGLSNKFTAGADGTLTYSGENGTAKITGTSDLEISAASLLNYGLFKNGILVAGAETPHDFSVQSKTENISITGIISIENGDIFQVRAKSDGAGDIITVKTLVVVITIK